ncbi:MAG: helicase-related protein, partial [Sediminispirochaetaceae bacterium]
GFRPALTRIPEIIAAAAPRMTSAFTATASDDVLAGIQEILFPDEPAHVIRADPDRPNISYHVIPVLSKRRELRRLLGRTRRTSGTGGAASPTPLIDDPFEAPNPLRVPRPALIFCSSRDGTEQLAETLRRDLDEDDIYFYHAGLERAEKKQIEDWFFGSNTGILCATTAYGMGVDKKNIRTVIHQDLSSSVEAFLQESGRGGRDGAPAYSIVLLELGGSTTGTTERQDQRQQALAQAFRDDTRCLRENLLALMGGGCEMCWGCDVCHRSRPARPHGQMELMAFFRVHTYRYTVTQAAELLQGVDSARPNRTPWNLCAGYGCLQDWRREEIEEAIAVLITAGYLKKPRRGLWRGLVGIDRRAGARRRRQRQKISSRRLRRSRGR